MENFAHLGPLRADPAGDFSRLTRGDPMPVLRKGTDALPRSFRASVLWSVLLTFLLLVLSLGLRSAPPAVVTQPVVYAGGQGYWLLAKDGGLFAYGDARYLGNNLNSG